jgi:hypothetical protein
MAAKGTVEPKRGKGRVAARTSLYRRAREDRARLFAAHWLSGGQNGVEAARAAGYQGSAASLRVTASRLLRRADVRAELEKHTNQVIDGMGIPEILTRLTELARSDLSNFTVKVTPEMAQAAIKACGSDEDKARYALAVIEGRGIGLDVPSALVAGRGQQLKSITYDHDAAGMPKTRIEVHDPLKALIALAKIRGILREKDVVPPAPRNLVVVGQLNLLPSAVLEALNDFLEAKAQKALPGAGG